MWSLKKFTSAYLFQIAREKSRDYVLMIYKYEKMIYKYEKKIRDNLS